MTCHCGQPAKARGMCQPHYIQWWAAQKPPCTIENCGNRSWARGLCRKHLVADKRARPESRCRNQRCQQLAKVEGWCKSHYDNQLGRQPKWTVRRAVVDWLTVDGGGKTAESIAAELGYHQDSVLRVLRALRDEGVVVSQSFRLAYSGSGSSYDQRTEWRMA